MYLRIYLYMYLCVCVYIYICVYLYVYMYISGAHHSDTYIFIYTEKHTMSIVDTTFKYYVLVI